MNTDLEIRIALLEKEIRDLRAEHEELKKLVPHIPKPQVYIRTNDGVKLVGKDEQNVKK